MHLARLFWALIGLAGLVSIPPAQAIWLSESGQTAWLTGSFETGDDDKFRAFLAQPRAQPIRVLYLSSHGGKITPAFEIGRMVRKAGITTAIQADSAVCSSACTFVFAGGVRRHNVNGNAVFEGMTSMSGLGFHPAHRPGDRVQASTMSDTGTSRIRAFYAEMGMPRASELMEKAAINTLYRPGGQTSLNLKIATSLTAP
jgi:hypothetical protein